MTPSPNQSKQTALRGSKIRVVLCSQPDKHWACSHRLNALTLEGIICSKISS